MMQRISLPPNLPLLTLLLALLLPPAAAGTPRTAPPLDFETATAGEQPAGWIAHPAGSVLADGDVARGGALSARLERDADTEGDYSVLTFGLPVDFVGDEIELRGHLKLADVDGWAGLWLREDGPTGILEMDNMADKQLAGDRDWEAHSIVLPLADEAKTLYIGALLSGTGRVWVDDLALFVDGRPLAEVPVVEPEPTVFDTDREFHDGSGIDLIGLDERRTSNLVRLCEVWGFLKYHHPRVVAGELHWDYELFRVLPRILAAGSDRELNALLLSWVDGLGPVPRPAVGAPAPVDGRLLPDLAWLSDRRRLGSDLSRRLRDIHRRRPAVDAQFHVSLTPGVRNAIFNELAYEHLSAPDAGYRLLALFRYWNIIRYWFPYRDLIDGDWTDTLREFLPRVAAADDRDSFALEMMALIARVGDTHANLWSEMKTRPPRGEARLPHLMRFVEGRLCVTGFATDDDARLAGLRIGDVIEAIDGVPVADLVESRREFYAASNEPTRLRDMANTFPRGEPGVATLTVERDGERFDVDAERLPFDALDLSRDRIHDLPGETFRLLSPDVAYLKLSSVDAKQAMDYVKGAQGTRGWIIDIRNYPSSFMVFALGEHLVRGTRPFAGFTRGDIANPGAFVWTRGKPLTERLPRYDGEIVLLVDEVSQSSAEYTTMAFRAAPRTTVIGSTTAGADGNISRIPLPGGMSTVISGIGVFYPDGTPTQRVGIVPDIELRPTIAGIRAGRDELLDAAIRRILGDGVTDAAIDEMLAAP